jgi:ABC-type amino acid transport substrate-binding protein
VDLEEIKQRGVLRHLGIPYANFVTGSGDGLDIELIQLFAQHLGVKWEFVQTTWEDGISDLTGKKLEVVGNDVRIVGDVDVKGDIMANGLTMLSWREKIVDFSMPTFPTQIWLLTTADFPARPIEPSSKIKQDILAVKSLLERHEIGEVMGKANTCVDPRLYELESTGAKIKLVNLNLAELVPALINGESESTLLDVPDALIALQKWIGQVKIIGPVSDIQMMGCAFSKDSPELRDAFNTFFQECKRNGTYQKLVKKYYPSLSDYFPTFLVDN